jgi:hypothetical protein
MATYMHRSPVQIIYNGVRTVSFIMRKGWRVVRDPLRFSRLRWFSLAWAFALGTLLMGAGFTIDGPAILVARGPFALYGHIFGGLHTHGAVLTVLGLGMVAGLGGPMFGNPEPRTFLRRLLKVGAAYYMWSWFLIMFAPMVQGGQFSFIGMILWAMVAVIPMVLATSLPPEITSPNETDLLQAALDEGLDSDKAIALVERFYHGGSNAHT